MKLVEILAEEMEVWPEGVKCLTQSTVDREIYDACDGHKEDSVDSLSPRFDTRRLHSEEDYPIVTRAQWQAERDKRDGVYLSEAKTGQIDINDNFKVDQIDGPIKWRDTVNELDAYIEKYTRERDALINRLALEGFALIPPVVSVVSEFAGVDMSDWRNWKVGDVFITDGECQYYTKGKEYSVHGLENDSAPIKAIDDNGDVYCLFMEEVKFIRRP